MQSRSVFLWVLRNWAYFYVKAPRRCRLPLAYPPQGGFISRTLPPFLSPLFLFHFPFLNLWESAIFFFPFLLSLFPAR